MSESEKSPLKLFTDDAVIRRIVAAQAQQHRMDVEFCAHAAAADLVIAPPVRLGVLLQKMIHLQQKLCSDAQIVAVGSYMFDPAQSILSAGGEDEIILTEKEAGILKCLLAAHGAYVSRRDLLNDVWGYVDGVETHTLETHIYRLRQKLEHDPARPVLLITSEQGYCLKVD